MNNNNSPSSKFLFDLNKFDVEEVVEEDTAEEIYVEPPAPTFSEDELEAAKAIAHSQGRLEGINEERQKREQSLNDNLKNISEKLENIFAAELYREKQYEEESLRLALEIIEQLAPSLNKRFGHDSLKDLLKEVMNSQAAQSEIRVEVHPDFANDIDQFITDLWQQNDHAPRCKVVANSDIELGGCALSWKDGGMIKQPSKMVQELKTAIQALLDDKQSAPQIEPDEDDSTKILQKNHEYNADNAVKDVTPKQNNAIKESDTQNSPPKGSETIESGD